MLPFQAAFAQNSAEIFDLHLGLSGEGSGLSRGFAQPRPDFGNQLRFSIFHSKEIGKGAKLEVVHRSRGRVTPSFQDERFLGAQPWPDVLSCRSPMVREGAEKERAMRTILLLRDRHSFKRDDSPLGKRRKDQRAGTESLQAPI
jgi:hypothetical protein